jgi:hypothetical protein
MYQRDRHVGDVNVTRDRSAGEDKKWGSTGENM